MPERAPKSLVDRAEGPVPVPGRLDVLAPGVRRLTAPNPGMMTGPGTNTYLIGTSELAVIDPGPEVVVHQSAIAAAAEEIGGAIRWILVTHHHLDHAPGARLLAEFTDAPVIGYGGAAEFVPDERVDDGWMLSGAGFNLRALHTPGHASDHLCWILDDPSMLFTGDHVMHGSTVVIRPPDGDMTVYLESLAKVADLEPAVRAIAPGHGRVITEPRASVGDIIEHRLEREAIVVQALGSVSSGTLDELLPLVYGDVEQKLLPVARMSLWAHLRRLRDLGRAACTRSDAEEESEGVWSAA
jgi:glyoxylase-like metal-dependent hydrolase (beta-lactamase superfamily II)